MKIMIHDFIVSNEPELPPPIRIYNECRGVAESGFSTWFGSMRRWFKSNHPALKKGESIK